MFEFLFIFGILTLGVFVLVGILKLLVAVLLLPLKLAWWAAQGLVGLLLVVPLAILGILVLTNVFPIVLLFMLLPVLIVVAGVGLLVKMMFC